MVKIKSPKVLTTWQKNSPNKISDSPHPTLKDHLQSFFDPVGMTIAGFIENLICGENPPGTSTNG